MVRTSDSVVTERAEERDYPAAITPVNHVEPVPRRIRAFLAGEPVLDSTRALYVWEWPHYPQYYFPVRDVRHELLIAEGRTKPTSQGTAELHTLRVGDSARPSAAQVLRRSPVKGLNGTARLDWNAVDAWFEEDERILVHPRNPYIRVDALVNPHRADRSSRPCLVL